MSADLTAIEERLQKLQVSIWQMSSGLVTIEAFAKESGYAVSTIGRAMTSSDPMQRAKFPEFRKSGGKWTTTRHEVLRWWSELEKSSYLDAEVRRALAEVGA